MRVTEPMGSTSLFELPVSSGARTARIAVVLLLDLILAGAGIAMILSYVGDRNRAADAATVTELAPAPAAVDVLDPHPVEETEVGSAPAPKSSQGSSSPRRARARREARPAPAPARDVGSSPTRGAEPKPANDVATVTNAAEGTTSADIAGDETTSPDDGLIEPDPDGVEGVGFSAAKVRRVVEQHTAQLQRCYQRAAKAESLREPLRGRVDVQFVIMPNGIAKDVQPVANTTGSGALAACVAGLIQSWQFPSPGAEEIAFVWPFVFRSPQ